MNEKDINEILKTIDIIKVVGSKLREELKVFSSYLIGFGIYIILNILISIIFNFQSWFYTLTLAFFIAHSFHISIPRSLIIWGLISIFVYISTFFINNYFLGFILLFLGIFIGSYIFGRIYKFEGKMNLISKIGLSWAFIYASLFYIIAIYPKIISEPKTITILNLYALGIAFFISSIIHYSFLIFSIVIILIGIPLFIFNEIYGVIIYMVVGIFMTIFGILQRKW